MPLARRLWRISKLFQIPINDERIQNLDMYDIEFYELSQIADDPKKLEKLKETYYDDEFDDYLKEFDEEQKEIYAKNSAEGSESTLNLPDEETIAYSEKCRREDKIQGQELEFEDDYQISEPSEINDWEEVK